jgi:CarD family transcriptional regulator
MVMSDRQHAGRESIGNCPSWGSTSQGRPARVSETAGNMMSEQQAVEQLSNQVAGQPLTPSSAPLGDVRQSLVSESAESPPRLGPEATSPVAASPVAASPVAASPVAASPVAASPVAASPVAASLPPSGNLPSSSSASVCPAGKGSQSNAADARPNQVRPPHNGPNLTPRAIAKAEIFVAGDHVVYPTHGVGKVERIAVEEIAGHKLELIHITFEENRMTLRVPVTKACTAGLRKLASRKLFDEAMTILRGRARVKRTMWSRRAQEYEAKINSGDPLAIAEVVRDLHKNSGQPEQSFSERQIYESAMDRLGAELGALDQTDKLTAITKLTDFLKTV